MTQISFNSRNALICAVSLGALTAATMPTATAATYLYGKRGSVPEDQSVRLGGDVTQIQMDDGSIVSLLGTQRMTLTGNTFSIDTGGVTVVGAKDGSVAFKLPNNTQVTVRGAASLDVKSNGVTGNVMGGDMRVVSNGRSRRFKAGTNWAANAGQAPDRVYANAAQSAPGIANLSDGQFVAAAINGLPVALGNALEAIGAGGDIVRAAQSVDLLASNPTLGALPSQSVAQLIGFSQQLASALGGGVAFEDAQPALIETYLSYLADGGAIEQFQTAYTMLITQYLDLLSTGNLPSAFTGLDLSAANAYLEYLDAQGIIETLSSQQQNIVTAYLDFLSNGGAPNAFLPPAAGLTDDTLSAYVMAIEEYVAFLTNGGAPADFTLGTEVLTQYLQQLRDGGLLETLLPIQAASLEAYLDFLGDGGDPVDFDGFDMAMGGDMGSDGPDGGDMGGNGSDGGDMGGNGSDGGDLDGDGSDDDDMGGDGLDGGDMGGDDSDSGDMGGGDIDFAAVGTGFDLTAANVILSYNYEDDFSGPTATQIGRNNVNMTRSAEGAFLVAEENGQDGSTPVFDVTDLTLERLKGDDQVLIARYAAGTADTFFGSDIAVDVLNVVAVADPITRLPVSGSATYALTQSNGVVMNDGSNTEGTLDGTLSLTFGGLPTLDIDLTLGLDTDYVFSVEDRLFGLSNSELFSATISRESGDGSFCSDGLNCFASLSFALTEDFTQAGASIRLFLGDIRGSGSAIFSAIDAPVVSFDGPAGATSGTLMAAFSGTQFSGSVANAGGLNQSSNFANSYSNLEGTFDASGLINLTQEFATFSQLVVGRNNAQVADLAGTADWQIGRFNGGSPTGLLTEEGQYIYGPNNGTVYAIISPLSGTLPTAGIATYSLLDATQPVYGDASTAPGSFNGDIAIDFAALRVGLDATITMPDATYQLLSTGGLASLSESSLRISSASQFSGVVETITGVDTALCGSAGAVTCRTFVDGALGGDIGTLLSLSYIVRSNTFSEASIGGTAVFEGGPAIDLLQPTGIERTAQSVAYSSSVIGIDQRYPSTTTYDETTGAVLAYDWTINTQESPHRGTAEVKDGGSVSDIIGWSRWAGGTSGGTYFSLNGADLPENGGWHLVSGTPATNLPTSGTVNYTLVGSTNPTIRDGSLAPGSVTGSAAVAFGATSRVGVDLNVTIGANTYGLSTPGGAADPMTGMIVGGIDVPAAMQFRSNDIAVAGSGPICSGSGDCTAIITGFLAGDGASHIGMAYTFGNTGFDTQVDGTAVFGRP